MSVFAGSILHVGGKNVIDRIQSAGLGDTRLQIETIREVGNREVVDKVPGEPDFTFSLEGLNATTELEAFLVGKVGAGAGSAQAPGAADPEKTRYEWLDMVSRCVNITSPWKDPASGSAGQVEAGHIVPGYYANRINYSFGVTDNSQQTAELAGGSYFYGEFAPVEQFETGDGSEDTFVTDEAAIQYRIGGAAGTDFRSVFGVMVDGSVQAEEVDYTVTGGAADPGSPATIVFNTPPENGADIRFAYFTSAAHAFPQSVHANVNVSPGAVRGRNIHVYIKVGGTQYKIGGIQSATLEGTVEGATNDRELGTEDPTGRTISGVNANGTLTVRSKDKDSFFSLLSLVTGVDRDEVFGWFNENVVELKIKIENPKAPGTYLKTLHVEEAKFQPPGTPARVNAATDFAFNYESNDGNFAAVKGDIDA